MNRLAPLVLAAGLCAGALAALGQGASATPFSDVPANHWAYQAIQSLAADGLVEGYPEGTFKGDRPLTRYEMAVIVARVIAKLQANGAGYASKADLDTVQKLDDALKDELDSLGVRVTNVEDALGALDRRTKFAQSIQLHGTLLHNTSFRQRYVAPQALRSGFGPGVPAGAQTGDAFVTAYLTSPDSNSPLEQAGAGNLVRYDDKFNLTYAVNENLAVSLPLHIMSHQYGGEYGTARVSVQPDVVVNIAKAGAFSNLSLRDGQLDNLQSSRVGLTYRAPDASQQGPGFEDPVQPYEKGFSIGGVFAGLTSFQLSWSRLDDTRLNTLTGVAADAISNGEFANNNYFFYRVPPQTGYYQNGAPNPGAATATNGAPAQGSWQNYSFTAQGPTTFVYLPVKAVNGTVTLVSVNGVACGGGPGTTYNAACPIGANGFYFLENNNQVVFRTPVPAGSTVTIGYEGLAYANNTTYQRYHANARVNQKIRGLPGAEVGLSFSRIFDFADLVNSGGANLYLSAPAGQPQGDGYGVVSDTVFGVDFALPLGFFTAPGNNHPALFGEFASTKYTPDFYNVASVTDGAAVFGLRLRVGAAAGSLQYQAVGKNYQPGAPLRFYGPAPTTFGYWNDNYLPAFFGFANNLAINGAYDAGHPCSTGAAPGPQCTATNPNFTTLYPVFNPFVASGPQYFSAFAPNTQGLTFSATSPVQLGGRKGTALNLRVLAQHLQEMSTNGFGQLVFNGVNGANAKTKLDKLEAGAQFGVPVLGRAVALNLSAGVEHLTRNDTTAYAYSPVSVVGAPTSSAGAGLAAGGSLYYPNYINDYHTTYAAAASVPVSRDVVFGVGYNTQGFHGAYGTTVGQNIAERKDIYTATMTYNIPKTTSSVSANFRNQKYTDFVLPTYNFSQNREDVNFTVRF